MSGERPKGEGGEQPRAVAPLAVEDGAKKQQETKKQEEEIKKPTMEKKNREGGGGKGSLPPGKPHERWWRTSQGGGVFLYLERRKSFSFNKHGQFLVVEEYNGREKCGSVLLLEGKNRKGY
jgi:hypothetical protein